MSDALRRLSAMVMRDLKDEAFPKDGQRERWFREMMTEVPELGVAWDRDVTYVPEMEPRLVLWPWRRPHQIIVAMFYENNTRKRSIARLNANDCLLVRRCRWVEDARDPLGGRWTQEGRFRDSSGWLPIGADGEQVRA